MSLFDRIFRSKKIVDLEKKILEAKEKNKQLAEDNWLLKELTPRPEMEYRFKTGRGPRVQERDTKFLEKLYRMHAMCPELSTCTTKLKQEVFRRGFEWEPKFVKKCLNCGKEFDTKVEYCDECKVNGEFSPVRDPAPEQYKEFEEFMKQCNRNKQSLIDVCGQLEDDTNIVDDRFMLILKDYMLDADGNIIRAQVKEIIRGDPIHMRIIADDRGIPGRKYWVCLDHRDVIEEAPGKCRKCSKILYEVFYVSEEAEGREGGRKQYFIKDECIHNSKYAPTKLYSANPPVSALYVPAFILVAMNAYIAKNYFTGRKPKSVVVMVTNNPGEAHKIWKSWQWKSQQDPHYVGMITVEPGETGGARKVENISFQDTLEEMQYTEARKEVRERIFGYYGVSPIFGADVSVSGGLNNEGLQIAVTNRAVELSQTGWNDEDFPELISMFNITDWNLKLLPSEEQDEMAEIQRKIAEAQHAQLMQQLGFEVKLNEKEEFEFSREPTLMQTPTMGYGGYGGFPSGGSFSSSEGEEGECPPGYHKHPDAYGGKCHPMYIQHQSSSMPTATQKPERFTGMPISVHRGDLEKLEKPPIPKGWLATRNGATRPDGRLRYEVIISEGISNPYHVRIFYDETLVYENKLVTIDEVNETLNQRITNLERIEEIQERGKKKPNKREKPEEEPSEEGEKPIPEGWEPTKTGAKRADGRMHYDLIVSEGLKIPYHIRIFYDDTLIFENKFETMEEINNALEGRINYIDIMEERLKPDETKPEGGKKPREEKGCPPGYHRHPDVYGGKCHPISTKHRIHRGDLEDLELEKQEIKEIYLGIKEIPVNQIITGLSLWRYVRTEEGWMPEGGRLTDYEEDMAKKLETLPPITVLELSPGRYELADGAHRLMLHTYKGRKTIRAKVYKHIPIDEPTPPDIQAESKTKPKRRKFKDDREVYAKFRDELERAYNEEFGELLKLKKKIPQDEMMEKVNNVMRNTLTRMRDVTDDYMKDMYDLGLQIIGNQLGEDLYFERVDIEALNKILDERVLTDAYVNMDTSISDKLNKIIREAYEDPRGFTIDDLVDRMKEEIATEEYRLRRIARTEAHTASVAGRTAGYKKADSEDKYVYKWQGPDDARTSDICKEIKQIITREGGAVPLTRMEEIVREVSLKHNGPTWQYRYLVPHINCRHNILRVV